MTNDIKPQFFVKLNQPECREQAKDEALPAHLRVFFLAITRAAPNRHAEFKRGELAKLLGKSRKRHAHLDAAIGRAVEYGLLHKDSTSTCLVLTNMVDPYDKYGNGRFLPCKTHGGTPRPTFAAICHPEKPHEAHGLCDMCYRREKRRAATLGCAPRWDMRETVDPVQMEHSAYLESIAADEPPDWVVYEPEMLCASA